jgi:hypothetical protein
MVSPLKISVPYTSLARVWVLPFTLFSWLVRDMALSFLRFGVRPEPSERARIRRA